VRTVLTNEKYIGNNVFNRSSFKLKKTHVDNPPDMWIRKEGAFDGIVPIEVFMTAQEIITARSQRLSIRMPSSPMARSCSTWSWREVFWPSC